MEKLICVIAISLVVFFASFIYNLAEPKNPALFVFLLSALNAICAFLGIGFILLVFTVCEYFGLLYSVCLIAGVLMVGCLAISLATRQDKKKARRNMKQGMKQRTHP